MIIRRMPLAILRFSPFRFSRLALPVERNLTFWRVWL